MHAATDWFVGVEDLRDSIAHPSIPCSVASAAVGAKRQPPLPAGATAPCCESPDLTASGMSKAHEIDGVMYYTNQPANHVIYYGVIGSKQTPYRIYSISSQRNMCSLCTHTKKRKKISLAKMQAESMWVHETNEGSLIPSSLPDISL